MSKTPNLPALADVESVIRIIRGQRVILDADIAALYGVPTKALVQAVKRNLARFPEDFMFQLSKRELDEWRSQIVTSNPALKMGLRRPPYAFTEHGVVMLSSVLQSPRAVLVNIELVRVFVRLRQALGATSALARRIAALEQRYDAKFKAVFDAIRSLMLPRGSSRKRVASRRPPAPLAGPARGTLSPCWRSPGRRGGTPGRGRALPASALEVPSVSVISEPAQRHPAGCCMLPLPWLPLRGEDSSPGVGA